MCDFQCSINMYMKKIDEDSLITEEQTTLLSRLLRSSFLLPLHRAKFISNNQS